jgi:hypothetical protein
MAWAAGRRGGREAGASGQAHGMTTMPLPTFAVGGGAGRGLGHYVHSVHGALMCVLAFLLLLLTMYLYAVYVRRRR